MLLRVYLDACCLNRLTDNQAQPRIRQEADAVEGLLKRMREGTLIWVSSEALVDEIDRNPNLERRLENANLLALASEMIDLDDIVITRSKSLHSSGYGPFDALHLACAEEAKVDVLLTTDDAFIRKAGRGVGLPMVSVRNPLFWSQEHIS